ncbi:uncharacterized protein LOC143284501 [Babylonia areolata]|uniref:uncharacterized protein LOC143284501 n=1 Tax=Babylonia areolata TaxID=304850 RepID=UPI003FD23721
MMQMSKQCCLVAVLALWCQCYNYSPVSACIDPDLANCTTAYTHSLYGPVITHRDQFCGVIQKYYSCIADICGVVPKDMLDFIVDAQTHYFDCGITGASARVAPSLFLLSLMSVILPILPTFLLH